MDGMKKDSMNNFIPNFMEYSIEYIIKCASHEYPQEISRHWFDFEYFDQINIECNNIAIIYSIK